MPAVAVAAKVGDDHPMPGGEMIDHRVEHLAGDHQPVHEQKRRPRPVLGEVQKLGLWSRTHEYPPGFPCVARYFVSVRIARHEEVGSAALRNASMSPGTATPTPPPSCEID